MYIATQKFVTDVELSTGRYCVTYVYTHPFISCNVCLLVYLTQTVCVKYLCSDMNYGISMSMMPKITFLRANRSVTHITCLKLHTTFLCHNIASPLIVYEAAEVEVCKKSWLFQ